MSYGNEKVVPLKIITGLFFQYLDNSFNLAASGVSTGSTV